MAKDEPFLASLKRDEMNDRISTQDFRCVEGIEQYLKKWAYDHHKKGITNVMCWLDGARLVGFVTVSMSEIRVPSATQRANLGLDGVRFVDGQDPRERFPALLIGFLGVHEEYRRRGVGDHMVRFAIGRASLASRTIGCRMVAVDSIDSPDAKGMYLRADFQIIEKQKRTGNVSMFYDLGPR